jgi:FkbM family methyltransferase
VDGRKFRSIDFLGFSLNRRHNFDWLLGRTGGAQVKEAILAEYGELQLGLWEKSESQLMQDLFVVAALGEMRDGFFVEFGACDGVELSNSLLLEREFGWRGILAEPSRQWHEKLRQNRSSSVDFRCVFSSSGESLIFHETEVAALSTLERFSKEDVHHHTRQEGGRKYEVESVSLDDLLSDYEAPAVVDYLSIDTEGSEWEILRDHNFSNRIFRVITVEHNYGANREKVRQLLSRNGYRRWRPDLTRFDDWYLHESVAPK